MGVWILSGDVGHMERAVLVDSVTETPLTLPCFEDEEDAELFLEFAAERGVKDVRALDPYALDTLHDKWIKDGRARMRAAVSEE